MSPGSVMGEKDLPRASDIIFLCSVGRESKEISYILRL